MSASDRATSAELAAEFDLAMGSLAANPLGDTAVLSSLIAVRSSVTTMIRDYSKLSDRVCADLFVRIAAIALEGAARLRRGT